MPGSGFRIAAAFDFAERNGLATEAAGIRGGRVHPSIARPAAGKKGYLIRLFESSGVMDEFIAQHWPNRHTPAGQRRYEYFLRRMDLNERRLNGEPVPNGGDGDDEDVEDALAFALEAHLRDFIAGNLKTIRINSKRLRLHADGERSGVEYRTGVGRIDILAVDDEGDFYVFELKLHRGPDRALGQLARYMGWVKLNLAGDKAVTGIVVASSIEEKLRYAGQVIPNIILLEYKVDFELLDANAVNVIEEST